MYEMEGLPRIEHKLDVSHEHYTKATAHLIPDGVQHKKVSRPTSIEYRLNID